MRSCLIAVVLLVLVVSGIGCAQFDYKWSGLAAWDLEGSPSPKGLYFGVRSCFAMDNTPRERLGCRDEMLPTPTPVAASETSDISRSTALSEGKELQP